MDDAKSRPVRPGAYTILFLLFATIILLIHLPWLGVPYFWDEAGYYVPAALDLFHGGSPVPHSVPPQIHPPALSAYLAAIWSLAGFHPESTRCAMLALAAAAALVSLLLAIELLRDARGMPAFLAAGMVCLSPVFFAQSLLAQPDMPAMLLTTLALWLFLRERIVLAAAACIALALVKETGIVAPIVFGGWLAYERRWRDAAWFLAPLVALGAWIGILIHATGHWAGTPAFADYNLFYPLPPLRVAVNALRRFYYLFFANLHWIGAFAILFAWRTSRIFRSRGWRIAGSLAVAHAATVTVLGGATLERYLLPVLPILYCRNDCRPFSIPTETAANLFSRAARRAHGGDFHQSALSFSVRRQPRLRRFCQLAKPRLQITSGAGIQVRGWPRLAVDDRTRTPGTRLRQPAP